MNSSKGYTLPQTLREGEAQGRWSRRLLRGTGRL